MLHRITLPFFSLCHIINSSSFADFWVFFSMTALLLLAASDHLGFRLLHPTFSISCGADYFTMPLTCSLLAGTVNRSSPVNSQSKAHTWWNTYRWRAIHNWVAGVSGEDAANGAEAAQASLWEISKVRKDLRWSKHLAIGRGFAFYDKGKLEGSKDRQGTRYIFRVWLYKHDEK